MLRPPPPISPPHFEASSLQAPPDFETFSLSLRLLTPMFGGSATPRQTDDEAPIRAAAIRGHLRFWWRATVGARYADAPALFQAEEELWGSAQSAGQVALQVEVTERGQLRSLDQIAPSGNARSGPQHRYFLFPFQENRKESIPEAAGREGVAFKLHLRFPAEKRDDVRAALRAWLFFGGIGSRTRRGCGALTVEGNEAQKWLPPVRFDAKWFGLNEAERNSQLPNLQGAEAFVGQAAAAMECWRRLGIFWTKFRKGHFMPHRSGRPLNPMDGGRWSDHETLRDGRYRLEVSLAKPYLGLPLIYQSFSGRSGKPASFAGTLEAAAPHGRRFASPVILKPAAFADGTFRPLILVLQGPEPQRIRIESRNGRVEADLKTPENDAVLEHFNVSRPLDAVCKAALADAERFTEVRL